jgi:hypothetical protein
MPEIEKLVAVCEIKKPGSDAVKTNFRAAGQEIRADAGGWLVGCLSVSGLHGGLLANSPRDGTAEYHGVGITESKA